MSKHRPDYHLMLPAEIDEERTAAPIAFIPWGAIEWHSYHNPIGLDGLIAHGLCRAVAEATGGIVLPPMYLATDTIKEFKGFPHSIEHPSGTVKLVCGELLSQLTSEGFKVIVLITGHAGGKHTDALAGVVSDFNSTTASHALLYTPFGPIDDSFPANHAADGETSLLLHLDSSLVDLARLPADRVATLDEDGVWGSDPRTASAGKGAQIIAAFVDAVSPEILAQLHRARQ